MHGDAVRYSFVLLVSVVFLSIFFPTASAANGRLVWKDASIYGHGVIDQNPKTVCKSWNNGIGNANSGWHIYYWGYFLEDMTDPTPSNPDVPGRDIHVTCIDDMDNHWTIEQQCEIATQSGLVYLEPEACAGPKMCEVQAGNPTSIDGLVKTETADDWVSPRDSRFRIRRYFRTDKDFLTAFSDSSYYSFSRIWRLDFGESVVDGHPSHSSGYSYYAADGKLVLFDAIGVGSATSGGHPYELESDASGWKVTDPGRWVRYFAGSGSTKYLSRIEWSDGYYINIERMTDTASDYFGAITGLTSADGQRAEFTYSQSAVTNATTPVLVLAEIDVDFDGVTFTPEVQLDYAFTENTRITEYPLLEQVSRTDVAASVTDLIAKYSYDNAYFPHAITEIYDGRTDGTSTLYPYTTITYGNVDETPYAQSASVSHPGGADIHTFATDASTNPLGLTTNYTFAEIDGMSRLTDIDGQATANCLGTALSYDYTPGAGEPDGYVYERIEKNGSRTTFTRDAEGRVLTKTEDTDGAAPRVTSYTWFGSTQLPATRATSQMVESFTYTTEGLLTQYSQTDNLTGSPDYGKTRTWDYSYTTLASGMKVIASIDGPGLVADGVTDVTTYAYDTDGNLASVTDPNGLVTEFLSYNAFGQPTLVRQPDTIEWGFDYDINGRVIETTYYPISGSAKTSTYAYDVIGQLISYTNLLGKTWSFDYDEARRLVKSTSPTGDEARYEHDAMGNVTRVEYADGASAADFWEDTEFDELGRLLETTGAEGQIWTFAHDVEDNLDTITDPLSLQTTHGFDALNRLVDTVDRAGYTTAMDYDDADQMTEYTDPRSIDTTFSYNGFGDVVSEVSADRGTITTTYNNRGLPASMTDARGIVATYEYDDGGRLTARRFPSAPAEDQTFSYDYTYGIDAGVYTTDITTIEGQAVSTGNTVTLASGAVVELLSDGRLKYDQNGAFDSLPLGQTASDSVSYTLSDGQAGTLDITIDANDAVRRVWSLDGTAGAEIAKLTLAGSFTIEGWIYFTPGTAITDDDAFVRRRSYPYQRMYFEGGKLRYYSYNPSGTRDRIIANHAATTGVWTHYAITRDNAGTMKLYVDGVLDSTSSAPFTYDGSIQWIGGDRWDGTNGLMDELRIWSTARSQTQIADNMNQAVDANTSGLVRYYSFDGFGTQITDETGHSANLSMPASGRFIASTSPVTGTPAFGPFGTINEVARYNEATVKRGYFLQVEVRASHLDIAGVGSPDLTTHESGSSYVRYEAGTASPVLEHWEIETRAYDVAYGYDLEDNLTSMTYPSGHEIALSRDDDDRITDLSVDLGAGALPVISGAGYLPLGPLDGFTWGDGSTHTATYDNSYRLTGLTDTLGATTLRDIAYTWTNRDNLASVTDLLNGANSESYGYSPREFLASADGPWDALDFTYDQVGNRLSRTITVLGTPTTDSYSYAATDNRLASISGGTARTFSYDAAGNVTFDNSTGAAYSYTYNAANRMESFAINGVVQAEYGYDPQGRQIIRRLTQQQKTIHNVFDIDGNRIAEYESDDLTGVSTLLREYVWMDGVPVAVVEGTDVYFIRTDHIGRPVFATDDTGAVVWTVSYLPFGGVHASTGTPTKIRFPGQWFQSENGLHQNWMRDYDPTTGRYIQADPLGLVDGASVYNYVLGNPLRRIDPIGLEEKSGTTREGRVTNNSSMGYTNYNWDLGTSIWLPPHESTPRGPGNDWDFISDGCECIKVFTVANIHDDRMDFFHRPFFKVPIYFGVPERFAHNWPIFYCTDSKYVDEYIGR